jgi:hypothetical protein
MDYPYQENFLSAYLLRSGIFFRGKHFNVLVVVETTANCLRSRALLTGWAIKIFLLPLGRIWLPWFLFFFFILFLSKG